MEHRTALTPLSRKFRSFPQPSCEARGAKKGCMMTQRILRRREVEARIGLSRSAIYAQMAEGVFPKPLRLGKRAVGWPETAIAQWLASRASA